MPFMPFMPNRHRLISALTFRQDTFWLGHFIPKTFQHVHVSSLRTYQHVDILSPWMFRQRDFSAQGHFGKRNFLHQGHFGTLQSNMDVTAQTFRLLNYCAEMSMCQNVPVPKFSCAKNSSCRKFPLHTGSNFILHSCSFMIAALIFGCKPS